MAYAFFQSAVEVPHCLLQHLSWDTTNFVLDSLFQFIQCPWPSRIDPILKVAPQEKITNGQIRWSWGPGNVTESCDDMVTEQFSNSCHWLPCSVPCRTILLKPGFVKLRKIVQCRCNKRLQHLNIRISKVPVFLCHLVYVKYLLYQSILSVSEQMNQSFN